jgi:ATP-dependent DNA helicase 2 subunit 2
LLPRIYACTSRLPSPLVETVATDTPHHLTSRSFAFTLYSYQNNAMADKRVTIYIVDVGSSTGECHNGRIETDLDYGMRYVWDKISKEMVADKASWQVGVIGLRTDETDNPLSGTEDYENISVLKTIGQMKMGDLAPLRRKIQPSETESGDAISAIVLAIDLITKATTLKSGKLGKYTRKIVLLTNGQGHIEDDGLESIAGQIKETEIQLVVMYVLENFLLLIWTNIIYRGVDFDDSDYGFKEEDKPSVKVLCYLPDS